MSTEIENENLDERNESLPPLRSLLTAQELKSAHKVNFGMPIPYS